MGQGMYYINISDFQYLTQNSDTLVKADSLPEKHVTFTAKRADTAKKDTLQDTSLSAVRKVILKQSAIPVPERQQNAGTDVPRETYVPELPEGMPSGALKDWMEFTNSHSASSCLSVFASSSTAPSFRKEIQRNQMLPDWFFLLFLAGLLVLSSAKMLYERYFNRVLIALTNETQALNIHKSRNLFTSQIFFLLLLNFVLIAPLAIYLLLNGEGGEYTGQVVTVLGMSAVVAGVIILRRILLYLTGELFQSHNAFGEYYLFVRNFYIKTGLVLLPFVLLGAYYRNIPPGVFLTAAAVLVGILYLERLYRGLRIASRYHVAKFYLILYLCALEILPVLLGYKIVRDLTGM